MTGKEIVRRLMDRENMGVTHMAELLGITPQMVWRRVNARDSRDLTVEKLGEMCSALGYKVVVIPKWCFVNPDGFVYAPDEDGSRKGAEGK